MIPYNPPRELFHIGSFTVYAWGLMFVIAFLTAFFFVLLESRRKKIDEKHIYNIVLLILIGAIVGARLFHVFENLPFYIQNPAQIFALNHGGMTSYGGIFLAILLSWLYVRKQHDLVFTEILDLFAPYIFLALAIGRIGCFLNWCCYGHASNMPWALKVSDDVARHPTQLYESIAYFFGFWILMKMKTSRKFREKSKKYKKTKLGALELLHQKELIQKPGFLFFSFLILYSAFRFTIDFLRDYDKHWIGLAFSQWICIAIFIFSMLMIARKS